MSGETPRAAMTGGSAPAPYSQDEIRNWVGTSLSQLADGSALLARCREFWQHRPGDVGMLRLAARINTADAVLGQAVASILQPPRRKAKSLRRQRLAAEIAELNSALSFSRQEER